VTYTNDTWVHLVWVHGGGNLTAYKNGVIFGSATASGNTGGGGNTAIGYQGSNSVNSDIDEVRVYNRALTALDVAALYQYGIAGGNRWRMMHRWREHLERWLWAGRRSR
jgi:hypothetical protein